MGGVPLHIEAYCKELFSMCDANAHDGFRLTEQQIAELLRVADKNHDGLIQYSELAPVVAAAMRRLPVSESSEADAAAAPGSSVPASPRSPQLPRGETMCL